MQLQVVLAVAFAGAVGAVARFALSAGAQAMWSGFPWHTVLVNVLGCFGFGVTFALASGRWSPLLATAVLVGFFGAFTTFSAFGHDCVALLRAGRVLACLVDIVVQNAVGLLAMWGGIVAGGGFPPR